MKRFPWWAALGAVVFVVGLVALVQDVPRWNAFWYVPAWWGYLLMLDALVRRLGGHSWLERPRELAVMLFWSAPFWFLFEAFNLRLENWYYVFVPRSQVVGEVFAWLSFATVLPACCFHTELVRALGWFEPVRWPRLEVGAGVRTSCVLLGTASIVAPLAWPRWAFPLIWGATLWLPELTNHRAGEPSLLGDLERGDPRRFLRLLTGGLLAGIAWEALNYWSRTKWIYSVPHFEEWKLFEMPVLGFLGFPVLAVAAFSYWILIRRLLRGGAARVALLALAAVVASHFVFLGMRDRTARSEYPVLAELEALSAAETADLRRAGIASPTQLVRWIESGGIEPLAAASGIERRSLVAAYEASRLALHKGMGLPAAQRLRELGIRHPEDLARQDPEELWRRLREAAGDDTGTPRLAEVRAWVRAARRAGGLRR